MTNCVVSIIIYSLAALRLEKAQPARMALHAVPGQHWLGPDAKHHPWQHVLHPPPRLTSIDTRQTAEPKAIANKVTGI